MSANPYVAALGMVTKMASGVAQKIRDDRTRQAFDSNGDIAQAKEPIEVSFSASGQQKVAHRLGRAATGFTIVCRMADVSVWDYQAPDTEYLYLQAAGAVSLKILAF